MLNEKVVALLKYLGEEVESIEIIGDDEIEVNGERYSVFTDEVADEEFYVSQENLFNDLGLEAYGEYFQEEIINYCLNKDHFDEMMEDYYRDYIEDIKDEEGRLEEAMENNEVEDEEEYLELLTDNQDSIQWYIDNFGAEELSNYIKDNQWLINLDEVINRIKEYDGRGCLATYDGEELELEDNFYAYRID